jgi:hypothetical protein
MRRKVVVLITILAALVFSASVSSQSLLIGDLMRRVGGRISYQNVRVSYKLSISKWVVEQKTSSGWQEVLRTDSESDAVAKVFELMNIQPVNTPTPSPIPATPFATSTVQPTATPSGSHFSEDATWHPPGAHGDRPPHEHGDPPPQWLIDWASQSADRPYPRFDHAAMTPNENVPYWKHTGFKGWAAEFNGQRIYAIFHLDTNPGGHVSRFHSYQLWILDLSGNVSYMRGWMDFGTGNSTGPQLVPHCVRPGIDDGVRPIINPPALNCPVRFENWYSLAGGSGEWAPDFGFNINPTYYAGGDPNNPATWTPVNAEPKNIDRRFEMSWYESRWQHFKAAEQVSNEFWTTQWGNKVSGPNDPVCGTRRRYGEREYEVLCLKQHIQSTLRSIQFPDNSVSRIFPGAGIIRLPN